MRNLLLSTVLIIVPVGVFAAGYVMLVPTNSVSQADSGPSLGDMSPFIAITTDVRKIAKTGDLAAAQTRITDLETAWDNQEKTLRPVNPTAWGNVDVAIDDALSALRVPSPQQAKVETTLATLQTALANPAGAQGSGSVAKVSGVAVTDANGHPIPCETMLDSLRAKSTAASLSATDKSRVNDFQAKGTERCNADDDTRADAFFAQGIALTSK